MCFWYKSTRTSLWILLWRVLERDKSGRIECVKLDMIHVGCYAILRLERHAAILMHKCRATDCSNIHLLFKQPPLAHTGTSCTSSAIQILAAYESITLLRIRAEAAALEEIHNPRSRCKAEQVTRHAVLTAANTSPALPTTGRIGQYRGHSRSNHISETLKSLQVQSLVA